MPNYLHMSNIYKRWEFSHFLRWNAVNRAFQHRGQRPEQSPGLHILSRWGYTAEEISTAAAGLNDRGQHRRRQFQPGNVARMPSAWHNARKAKPETPDFSAVDLLSRPPRMPGTITENAAHVETYPGTLYISRTDARYARSLTSFTRPIWAFSFCIYSIWWGAIAPLIPLITLIPPYISLLFSWSGALSRTFLVCLRISYGFTSLAVSRDFTLFSCHLPSQNCQNLEIAPRPLPIHPHI